MCTESTDITAEGTYNGHMNEETEPNQFNNFLLLSKFITIACAIIATACFCCVAIFVYFQKKQKQMQKETFARAMRNTLIARLVQDNIATWFRDNTSLKGEFCGRTSSVRM